MSSTESDKGIVRRTEETPSNASQKGKNYLLVIAIDNYKYCPSLYNCVKDAKRFIEILTRQYDFDHSNVQTLFNEEATEKSIYQAFRKLVKELTAEDNLVIYFSGHGEYDKDLNEGFWIPVNAQLGAQEDFMSNTRIKTMLDAIKSKHTFLIADSCFSGSLFTHYKSATIADRLENDPSRWGLTAGRNEVVSDGQPGDHSPFADSLLYQLEHNKEPLGVSALCNRVIENVIANAAQTPRGEPLRVRGHKGGQFFFRPKQEKKKPPKQEVKSGNVLYQIPKEMELDKATRCVVRIAFNKATLVKEIELTNETNMKAIRISNLMEVDLLDPLATGNFEIRGINQREQIVDSSDFTQWLFYVKAKKEGTHPLLLKVTVIEMLYGKERRKDIVLEELVNVRTEKVEEKPIMLKDAGYALSLNPTATSSVVMEKPTNPVIVAEEPRREASIPSAPRVETPPIVETPPVSRKPASNTNMYRILGGIAAALVFVVIAGNVFFSGDKINPGGLQNPKPKPVETLPNSELLMKSTRNGKVGFINRRTGEVVIKHQFDAASNFNEDVAFVKKGEKWALINIKGEYLTNFVIFQPSKFVNGEAKVDIGLMKDIVIDKNGETTIRNRKIKLNDFVIRKRQEMIKQ